MAIAAAIQDVFGFSVGGFLDLLAGTSRRKTAPADFGQMDRVTDAPALAKGSYLFDHHVVGRTSMRPKFHSQSESYRIPLRCRCRSSDATVTETSGDAAACIWHEPRS